MNTRLVLLGFMLLILISGVFYFVKKAPGKPVIQTQAVSHTSTTNNVYTAPAEIISTSSILHTDINNENQATSTSKTTAAPPFTTIPATAKLPEASVTPPPKLTSQENQMFAESFHFLNWGVFTGSNPSAIREFESKVSTNPDYLAYFIHWGNGGGALPKWLESEAADKDRKLIIFWEASDYTIGGTVQPAYSYRNILAGNWDEYFVEFAEQLAAYDGDIILVPLSELNGNWNPWSGTTNGNSPEDAVRVWRHLHPFFADLPNVQIGWAVNSYSVPNTFENRIENYYPGDDYVDIVGVDGFNMNDPWMSFGDVFEPALKTLSRYNKPIFLFSFGSAEGPQKSHWLTEGLYEVLPKYTKVEAWVYFNQNKERNWLLWSDANTFSVFQSYINGELVE